jgi:hypothetical protein
LHRLRQLLVSLRQPQHTDEFARLDSAVATGNPYFLTETENDRLNFQGGCGPAADLETCRYLYLLCSIKKLTLRARPWVGPVLADGKKDELWKRFRIDSLNSEDGWVALSRYCSGTYHPDRRIGWWTPFDLTTVPPREGALRIGLASNWHPVEGVILRCNVAALPLDMSTTVPSVVDAYISEIFHPCAYSTHPRHGLALDIRDPGNLAAREKEFVLGDLPAEAVDILPVEVRAAGLHPQQALEKDLSIGLVEKLIVYYEALVSSNG